MTRAPAARLAQLAGVVLSALAALFASAAQGQSAKDVNQLLRRYIEWRGGQSFERLQSLYERGDITLGQLHGSYREWDVADGRSRSEAHLGPLSLREATDAEGGWSTTASSQTEDLGKQDADSQRRWTLLLFAAAVHADDAWSLLGIEQREGRAWAVLRRSFGGADTYDLFIAPASGELLGARLTEDQHERFVRFDEWRVIDGVRVPMIEETSTANPADHQLQRAHRVRLNVRVREALFSRPPDHRIWSFAPGTRGTGWIDFDYYHENQIFIPARANGRAVDMMLDSGAGITVVDRHFAAAIGLATRGAIGTMGAVGLDSMQMGSDIRVSLGSLRLWPITAGVMDLSGVASMMERPLPMILGREAFDQLVIDIDFRRRRIAFEDPSFFTAPAGAVRLPLAHHSNLRTIPLSVEGAAPAPFDLDLGNDGPLIIYSAYRDQERLLKGRRLSERMIGGVGGMRAERVSTLHAVEMAGLQLRDVPVIFPDAGYNAVTSNQAAGNVGLAIFSRFEVITDYPHDALWLVPDEQSLTAPFRKERSGLATVVQGRELHIVQVAPGSPAETAGCRVGDDIVAVNGQPVAPGADGGGGWYWNEQPAGTVVTLRLADGSLRQLTLADYY